ncbi:MAG: DUF2207 domain-containing protein, partial [Thermodesulfobacteriota bacterium]
MSRITPTRILILFLLSLAFSLSARSEEIKNFHSEIFINRDGTIDVRENIEYDFQYAVRHGIYRDIPYDYDLGYKKYSIKLDVHNVTDFNGKPYKYEVSSSGGYIHIRIGDPDTTITGVHGYKIEYTVRGVVRFFQDHDELYWNVTGNEWRVPIMGASAKVYHQEGVSDGVKAECYTGSIGSKNEDCTYNITPGAVEFRASGTLWAGQGFTVVVGLPKGFIVEPSSETKALWFIYDNWYFALPFITLFAIGYIWSTRGRDLAGNGVITVRYEPPKDLTPAEAGTLIDERADILDITSTIIDLAVRGYLKIEEIASSKFFFFSNRDYKLVKLTEPAPGELKPHEEKVLSGIFKDKDTVLVSDLRDKFYTELPSIKSALYNELVDKKYFPTNPERVKNIYKWTGIIILVASFIAFSNFPLKLSVALSGLIILISSRYMPRKTKEGALMNEELHGFREFIDRAEKDRIEALAKNDPTLFDRVLPFALVFGLADRWANAFRDLYKEPPSWYSSPNYGSNFTPNLFVLDLGRSLSMMNSSLT